ncbi:MAG: response regulator [Clostridiaceae bacterium]|nr:response regulator [Clostridiaceae bacterium]
MYSVLIVDDDRRICEGLSRHIDWMNKGFCQPVTALNGHEALQIFKKQKIDLLITDIRMPLMSGLELAERVSRQYGNTSIVILSGYNDFEYAKTAMKFGIKHYLTKPTDLGQFSALLEEIKNELDVKHNKNEKIKELEKKYSTAIDILIEQFFIDLSLGAIKKVSVLDSFFQEYDLNFHYPYYNIISIKIYDIENQTGKLRKYEANQYMASIKNIISITLNAHDLVYYTFSLKSDVINIVINSEGIDVVNLAAENILNNIRSISGATVAIAISECVTDIEHLSICYNQTEEMYSLILLKNLSGIIQYSPVKKEIPSKVDYIKEKEKLLLSCLMNAEADKALNMVDSIFQPLYKSTATLDNVREHFVRVFFAVESYLKEHNVNLYDITEEEISVLKKAQEFSNVEEFVNWVKALVLKITDYINNSKVPCSNRLAELIKKYIEENYMHNISLYTASEKIYLSPTYISKIFKKVTGSNFVEYLTTVRMEQAKKLLLDYNYKIYEIGGLVGYKSIKHFSQVFKKYTGMTPTEFRKGINPARGDNQ